jgi:hypothetical protein
MSRILGGCTSVSMVRATIGFSRRAWSFGALVDVHRTTSDPFQVNPIGMLRGVPSLATYAMRVKSRASISWLSGRFRISVISLWSIVIAPSFVASCRPGDGAGIAFSTRGAEISHLGLACARPTLQLVDQIFVPT